MYVRTLLAAEGSSGGWGREGKVWCSAILCVWPVWFCSSAAAAESSSFRVRDSGLVAPEVSFLAAFAFPAFPAVPAKPGAAPAVSASASPCVNWHLIWFVCKSSNSRFR